MTVKKLCVLWVTPPSVTVSTWWPYFLILLNLAICVLYLCGSFQSIFRVFSCLPSFLAFFVLSTFFKIIIQFSLVSHWALGVFYFHLRKMKAREGVTECLRYCLSLELVSQSSISVVQVTEQPSPASAHSWCSWHLIFLGFLVFQSNALSHIIKFLFCCYISVCKWPRV